MLTLVSSVVMVSGSSAQSIRCVLSKFCAGSISHQPMCFKCRKRLCFTLSSVHEYM